MKFCTCGSEIKEHNKMCSKCFHKLKNYRLIAHDEIVLDCDIRGQGDEGIRRMCMVMSLDSYKIKIFKHEGGKSYHAHIQNIPHIAELPKEQNRRYKELIIKKYISKVREFVDAPELDDIDFNLCKWNFPVAKEGLAHYRYKTKKKFVDIINPDYENFCDLEIYNLATKQKISEYIPKVQGSGITARIIENLSIISLAKEFGLDVNGNKTSCPFHADGKTPSLVFYESQGRFHCFGNGCNADGNIIMFYAMMKRLNKEKAE